MAQTIKTFVSDGTQTLFTFEFDYIRKEFVTVIVDGSPAAFTLSGTYQITLAAPATAGDVILIQRKTETEKLVDFADGSILLASDLNLSALQAIHIAEEALDKASGGLLIDNTGAYTAGFRRLADLGDPQNDRDAVTKQWSETALSSQLAQAITAKNAAETARSTAEAAVVTTGNSATAASSSATSASGSATSAANSATAASSSETAAANSASAASGSASAASGSATAAGTAEGVTLGYRNEAEGFRDQAATSAGEAAASATSFTNYFGFFDHYWRPGTMGANTSVSTVVNGVTGFLDHNPIMITELAPPTGDVIYWAVATGVEQITIFCRNFGGAKTVDGQTFRMVQIRW